MMNFEPPAISSLHRQVVTQALDAYDEVWRLNSAIDKQSQRIVEAKAVHEGAAKALAESDTELALATTDAASRRIEESGKKLVATLAEATSDVDRQVRVAGALSERLKVAEATLDTEKTALQKVVQDHAHAVIQAFAEHVARAAAPMIEAMRMLVVAANAAGASATNQLSDMVLPDLRDNGYLLYGLSMQAKVDGEMVRLGDIGDDPTLAELVQSVREPRAALTKLEAYRPRTPRSQEQSHGGTLRQIAN